MRYLIKGRHNTSYPVDIVVFRDVHNAASLLAKTKAGDIVDVCLLDAAKVPDLFIPLVATSNALRKHDDNAKVTKTIPTEIIYNLSPTRNISYALQTFGISAATVDVIAIVLSPTEASLARLTAIIDSTSRSNDDEHAEDSPMMLIRRIHSQLQCEGAVAASEGKKKTKRDSVLELYGICDEEIQDGDGQTSHSMMVNSIVTRMACRDIK